MILEIELVELIKLLEFSRNEFSREDSTFDWPVKWLASTAGCNLHPKFRFYIVYRAAKKRFTANSNIANSQAYSWPILVL